MTQITKSRSTRRARRASRARNRNKNPNNSQKEIANRKYRELEKTLEKIREASQANSYQENQDASGCSTEECQIKRPQECEEKE